MINYKIVYNKIQKISILAWENIGIDIYIVFLERKLSCNMLFNRFIYRITHTFVWVLFLYNNSPNLETRWQINYVICQFYILFFVKEVINLLHLLLNMLFFKVTIPYEILGVSGMVLMINKLSFFNSFSIYNFVTYPIP